MYFFTFLLMFSIFQTSYISKMKLALLYGLIVFKIELDILYFTYYLLMNGINWLPLIQKGLSISLRDNLWLIMIFRISCSWFGIEWNGLNLQSCSIKWELMFPLHWQNCYLKLGHHCLKKKLNERCCHCQNCDIPINMTLSLLKGLFKYNYRNPKF